MNAATVLLTFFLILQDTQGMYYRYPIYLDLKWVIFMSYYWNISITKTIFKATESIDSMELTADPMTTTPNNCTCTSICRCAVEYSDCDPGNPISWWPNLNTAIGEVRD